MSFCQPLLSMPPSLDTLRPRQQSYDSACAGLYDVVTDLSSDFNEAIGHESQFVANLKTIMAKLECRGPASAADERLSTDKPNEVCMGLCQEKCCAEKKFGDVKFDEFGSQWIEDSHYSVEDDSGHHRCSSQGHGSESGEELQIYETLESAVLIEFKSSMLRPKLLNLTKTCPSPCVSTKVKVDKQIGKPRLRKIQDQSQSADHIGLG